MSQKQGMTDTSARQSLVTFRLEQRIYALPIAPIVQIVEMVAITPLPGAIGPVEGVINYHGQSVPVIDMRRYLGLPRVSAGLDAHMLLTRMGERTVALVVDQVLDIRYAHVAHTDAILGGFGAASYLQGVVHAQEGTLVVLDPERFFLPGQEQALTVDRDTARSEEAK
jgi:chemotaxis signal transduction protein